MSIVIEAIYEEGVLKPLEHRHLREHTCYRLMLLEETPTTDHAPGHSITTVLAERTSTLTNGQTTVDVFGIFHHDGIDLGYDAIEATLNDLCHKHIQVWKNESQYVNV